MNTITHFNRTATGYYFFQNFNNLIMKFPSSNLLIEQTVSCKNIKYHDVSVRRY